ncbi:ATP-binding protein, partial [Oceanicella sp. SM1341]|uniref:ATP-binding protein n=1 Tax=Oceanicella sp. SM1341 TaxID=1548889 RepID=UPI0035144BCD
AAARAAQARRAREAAEQLGAQLTRAEAQQRRRDDANARLKASATTPAWLEKVTAAEARLGQAQAALRAGAATARITYDGPARALLDGAELPGDTETPLGETAVFTLPGIGRLTLRSGEGSDAGALARAAEAAAAELATLLRAGGVGSLAEARTAAQAHAEDRSAAELAGEMLKALAPEGLDHLRAMKAEAEAQAGTADTTEHPPLTELEAALEAATAAEDSARAALDAAMADLSRAREAAAAEGSARDAAARETGRAAAAAGPEEGQEDRRTAAARALALAEEAEAAAREQLDTLRRDAPDLDTLRADLTRARQAIDGVAAQRGRLRDTLLRATGHIRALADGAIEERRDELAGRLDAAQARAARLEAEVRALQRLRTALESTRSAARDAYFGPVRDELKPLLNILHAEAELSFDSDSMLPAALTRGAAEEAFDTLSGGTQEQIAILTRLAFARLFARQGRELPIILDDALVYSDDSRIVKMFTALTRVAFDQQILVFSCRQLAFQDLGGARPLIEVAETA